MLIFFSNKYKVHPRTSHEDPEGGVEACLYSFFNFGARCGGCQRHSPVALPGTNGTGSWVGPRVGLDECENLAHIGTQSPESLSNSQSLYRLSYPGPHNTNKYLSLNCIQRQQKAFKITKLFYFSARSSSCLTLGLTYTNTLFDLLASNVFHRAASISSRSTKSTVMKSEDRGGQTIRPLDQQTELKKDHSA